MLRASVWRRRLIAGVACLALAACEKGGARTAPLDRPTAGAKILLVPIDVELAELSAGGVLEPHAEWTDNAKRHMLDALDRQALARSISFVKLGEPHEGMAEADLFAQLEALHGVVGRSIMVHEYEDRAELPNKRGRFDWSLGASAARLGEAYGTEYALFILVRDSYTSTGRAAAIILAAALLRVPMLGGSQIGFASLVDLKTGNIVWFNRLSRPTGDLRTATPAEETVRTLLSEFPK